MRELAVEWLGRVPYGEALALQEEAVAARRAGRSGDRLLLLEHPPVVTLGRSSRLENLLVAPETLARRGVELFETARGGDVTYHAPGQLVGYLVTDLAASGRPDVHRFLREVEERLLSALARLGVAGRRIDGRTGVFVDDPEGPPRKIASIGVGLRSWVTWHGFALNVSVDLAGFAAIVPCGLRDVVMTSVSEERADSIPDLDARARSAVTHAFATAP
jgi:lipoyl(octanoyl) transferase